MTELELRNVNLSVGDKLKVKGVVLENAERFQIDLGSGSDDLALHFNPRFHDDVDQMVIVCNSKCGGCWDQEQREDHNPFNRGSMVKVTIKLTSAGFELELPDGQTIEFLDRMGLETLNYVRVKGHFKLTSFKIC